MYAHNKIVYQELNSRLNESSRVCVVQATGTGKGVIASHLVKDYIDKGIILILAPSLSIIENYKMNINLNYSNVIFFTYQKLSLISKTEIDNILNNVCLIILDEFHRVGAKIWGENVSYLCKSDTIKVVGFSATPIRYLDNEKDMSIDFFKGNIINGLNLTEAVVNGVLPSFTYITSFYGCENRIDFVLDELNKKGLKLSDDISKILPSIKNILNIGTIIQKETKQLNKNQKWIIFFNDYKELCDFEDYVANWFNYPAHIYRLHSYQSSIMNKENFQKFNQAKVGVHIMLSINMLNEGVHINDIDGVIMLRRTVSPIIFLQQLGRALQVGGKSPIIFDFIGNYRRVDTYSEHIKDFDFLENINKELKNHNMKSIIIKNYCKDIDIVMNKINSLLCKRWEPWEDDFIKREYSNLSSKEIQKKLPYRTVDSIRARAKYLGITDNKNGHNWSDVEIEILEKYYPEYGFSKVQEFLPYLSRRQIVGKANRLNIHLENYGSNFWSVKEENILKKYYPLEGIHCKKRLPNKTENQVRHKANDLNIYRQYVWDADRLSVLQEYFPKGGYKLVYEKLNGEVSVEYIRGKARELGLKYSDSRWWTPEEDEIIIKYYPTMGCKVNCYLPNRSNSGIMNRAKKLNITYNKNK